MYAQLIVSLPFVFILAILTGLIIYLLGRKTAVKGHKTASKTASYGCGEDLSTRKFQVNVEEFLIYTVCFLIFDIFAFTLATSLGTSSYDATNYLPAIYSLVALMAIIALLPLRRRR